MMPPARAISPLRRLCLLGIASVVPFMAVVAAAWACAPAGFGTPPAATTSTTTQTTPPPAPPAPEPPASEPAAPVEQAPAPTSLGPPLVAPSLSAPLPAPAAAAAPASAPASTTRTVSRTGELTIACGVFDTTGVTGTCGARRAGQIEASAVRSPALTLAARPFRAVRGKAVNVRFRLGKASMRSLKAMRTVRMRVLVSAQDAQGHDVAVAPVVFTMKAPRARG